MLAGAQGAGAGGEGGAGGGAGERGGGAERGAEGGTPPAAASSACAREPCRVAVEGVPAGGRAALATRSFLRGCEGRRERSGART